jgi:septal ring factor EnvC (AmiA/AmiB activator)
MVRHSKATLRRLKALEVLWLPKDVAPQKNVIPRILALAKLFSTKLHHKVRNVLKKRRKSRREKKAFASKAILLLSDESTRMADEIEMLERELRQVREKKKADQDTIRRLEFELKQVQEDIEKIELERKARACTSNPLECASKSRLSCSAQARLCSFWF